MTLDAQEPGELGRLLRRLGPSIYLPSTVYSIGTAAVVPVVPLLGLQLGLSVTQVALVTTLAGVLTVVGPIPTGRLMSRIGERNGLIVGGLVAVLALAACLVAAGRAAHPPAWAAPLFVAGILVLALADLTWDLGRQTYLADQIPAHLRARAMTLFGGSLRVGRVLGPLVGAVLLGVAGPSSVFVVHLVAALVCIVAVLLFIAPGTAAATGAVTEAIPPADRRGPVLRRILLVGLAVMVLAAGRTNRDLLLPLLGHEFGHSAQLVSLVFAVTSAVELALIWPAGALMERYGRLAVLAPCMIGMGLAFLGSPLAVTVGGFFAVGTLLAVANGLGAGINKTLSADLTPARNRASWMGLWNSLVGAGQLVGPGLISITTAVASVAAAGVATGVLSLVGAGWAILWLPRFVPRPRR